MPDEHEQSASEEVGETSLHAHDEDRDEQIEGGGPGGSEAEGPDTPEQTGGATAGGPGEDDLDESGEEGSE